ncbi:MAG: amidohydrolase family protein [Clostridia bacterium]|nr:amidohydrolase family protein [Clostridia bacterium]
MSDYKIFANHAHLFAKNTKPNADIDKLKELLDACEIEKAVCFAPFTDQLARYGITENSRKWLANEIKNEPQFVGFGTIDFDEKNLKDQVKETADSGLLGLKIHPAAQELKIDSPELFEVYEEAEKQGLFISFHTGLHWHRIKDYQMLLFDEVAYNFPKLRFSMEHIGGYSFFKEALLVMNNNSRDDIQHVFAGWTSISMEKDDFGNERQGAWSLTDDELCTLIHQTGPKRSIFGLDFPYKDIEYTKKAIERIKNLPITEEAKRGILGDNLREILLG